MSVQPVPSTAHSLDLAVRMLHLEQQIDSYQRLHSQEMEDLRRSVAQLREEVLALLYRCQAPAETTAPGFTPSAADPFTSSVPEPS